MQKGVYLFLAYTNMNKIKSLLHVKEHPKISNFLQFESHSNKSFKVRNKIQGLTSLDPNFCNLYDLYDLYTGIIQKTLSKLVFMYRTLYLDFIMSYWNVKST